jgi:glycosyltransferase involved in cell wall biosynthesis
MNKTKNINISLVILTKNESENIQNNFGWLKDCPKINELICIDDFSDDDTIKQIEKLQSKNLSVLFYRRGLDNNFSSQRQFGIEKASNDMILWLDADETPDVKLIEFINHIDTDQYNYSFNRLDTFLKKELHHGETANQSFLRLFNKKSGQFVGQVHEKWVSSTPTKPENLIIHHHAHTTLKEFFTKINFYSDIRSHELFSQKISTNVFEIIFYPKAKFIYNYFILGGFLDGTPGIIFALGMSLQSFLSKAKLWHLSQTPSTG